MQLTVTLRSVAFSVHPSTSGTCVMMKATCAPKPAPVVVAPSAAANSSASAEAESCSCQPQAHAADLCVCQAAASGLLKFKTCRGKCENQGLVVSKHAVQSDQLRLQGQTWEACQEVRLVVVVHPAVQR